MKVRAIRIGKRYKFQRKFFLAWADCDLQGRLYHSDVGRGDRGTVATKHEADALVHELENTQKPKFS